MRKRPFKSSRTKNDENDILLKRLEYKWFEIKNLLRFTCNLSTTESVIEEMDKLAGWVMDETRDALEHENANYSIHFMKHLGVAE
jgi:hypothetical protein